MTDTSDAPLPATGSTANDDASAPGEPVTAGTVAAGAVAAGTVAAGTVAAGTVTAPAPAAEPIDLDAIGRDLDDVQTALDRLNDGTYWVDEVTGEPIHDAALVADPTCRSASQR